MSSAVVIVDVQNDFCEGGSLAVTGGAALAAALGERIARLGVDHVVATRDHHIDPGAHFSDQPDFATSWPRHCVVGTPGVELHPELDTSRVEAVFDKGEHVAAYSGFEASCNGVDLASWLRERGVTEVSIVGIAADYCVRATALDSVRAGFVTTVHRDLIAGVAPASTQRALAELTAAGVTVV